MIQLTNLSLIQDILKEKYLLTKKDRYYYSVPSLWLCYKSNYNKKGIIKVNPYKFFLDAVNYIKKAKSINFHRTKHGEWTKSAVIYNLFIRTACAFDHNQDGDINIPLNEDGFRETGTFIKAIAILPYIKSLGINTIHLLPITSIGLDGKKGNLGSPYAIKNPYEIDQNLSEPNIGVGSEIEFKAFVESAHKLGIRIVLEFVFRTMSKDGDWIREHPEWFYWIRENILDREPGSEDETKYGSPFFSLEELEKIFLAVGRQKFDQLIPPHNIHIDLFTEPPKKETLLKEGDRYIGILENGLRVRIPGAFADWPPNDSQPPWGDVTYLKLYDHPDFKYISYNTIRMYDSKLAQSENINRQLWEKIIGIIPHYQRAFGIDGVMIDMGHALPMELKQKMIHKAREIDNDFAFWDENFSVTKQSVDEGYNAVIGYCWIEEHDPIKLRKILLDFSTTGFPLPFFSTSESHNTPRAATKFNNVEYSKYSWVINNFIPAIPFLHNGFEIGEARPINTGLGFTTEELLSYPPDKLPLFSNYTFDWNSKKQFINLIKKISKIREKNLKLIIDNSPKSFIYHNLSNPDIIAFERKKTKRLLIIANGNPNSANKIEIDIYTKKTSATDLISEKHFSIERGKLKLNLKPFQCVVFKL